MSITVQARDMGAKQTLASAVQGTKPAPAQTPERQPDTVETPPAAAAATTAPEKKDDFLSPKFAALARQEKQIRAERERLKAEKEAFEREKLARPNGYTPKEKPSPLQALEAAGYSYDDLVRTLTESSQSQVDPYVRSLEQKLAALESNFSQLTKKQEESQTTAYKQAVETIRHKVKGIVDSSPDFETIKALDQTEAVVALIEETFKADGYVMSEEEAAREVEEHLVAEAIRMAGLEKVKKKLAPPPAESAPTSQAELPAQEKQATHQQPQIRTLSNAVAQATPTRKLTERERRERAILAAQGKLNN